MHSKLHDVMTTEIKKKCTVISVIKKINGFEKNDEKKKEMICLSIISISGGQKSWIH